MKNRIYLALLSFAVFGAVSASAQESDNIINRYGPPYYTGGSVPTTSESFAYSQASERGANIPTSIESVYPNPTRNNAAVVLERTTSQPVTIYIVNMNGVIEKTYTYSAGNRSYAFDVGNLTPGLYSIQVQERGKSMQSIELLKQQ